MNPPEYDDSLTTDKVIFHADRYADMMTTCGGILFFFCMVVAAAAGNLDMMRPGFAAVVMAMFGVWQKRNAWLSFNNDCFETRLAPAAGWHTVLYSEVTHVEASPGMLLVQYRKHNAPADAKPARIKLKLGALKQEERTRCIDTFRSRLPASVFV